MQNKLKTKVTDTEFSKRFEKYANREQDIAYTMMVYKVSRDEAVQMLKKEKADEDQYYKSIFG